MRSLPALLLALVLGACASPETTPADARPEAPAEAPPGEPVAAPDFDTAAWIAAVEAAPDDTALVSLSETLLGALDWRAACGEDDPTVPRRGIVQIHRLGAEAIAEVTCQAFAYQSVFAVVDLSGATPRLVRARIVGEDGRPSADVTESFLGVLSPGDAPRTFAVLTKSAGHGGCGTDVRYRLRPDGSAAIATTRAYADCDDALAPEAWPVTFTAE
ncbi:hypothetical protein [Rubrivirga sp. IMCC45206]|uniref:hypothetical protein n=1 Tax=Rubrivirga sp. IMCC45206 TaxID=3391614 RepID=UPI00398FC728